jgi:hypothetical protein
VDIPAGSSSCAALAAADASGNKASVEERCVSAPLDALNMNFRNTHWRDVASKSAVSNGVMVSRKRSSQASIRVRGNQIGVVMERCSSCGTVELLLNGKRIARASTRGKNRSRLVIRSKKLNQVKKGTLVVRRAAGGNIRLDAVIAWQS